MKKYSKILSLLTLLLLFVVSSCNKEEETKSLSAYLTAGNWKVTAMTVSPGIEYGGAIITDFYSLMTEDCSKDDWIKFNTNGSITEDEGTLKCDDDDPQQTTNGSWTLNESTSTLTISYPGETSEMITIVSINETTMVVNSTMTEDFKSDTVVYIVTMTFKLQ